MNMRFQQPDGVKLQRVQGGVYASPLAEMHEKPRATRLKYFLLSGFALAGIYLLTTLSATILWIIAATSIGLLGLATAVCIYAMNNTP